MFGANATAGETTYASHVSNTHTGTTSTNVAGYFSATGGTNNYGLVVANGNVAVGSTTVTGASTKFQVTGNGGTGTNGLRFTHPTEGSNWDFLIGGTANSFQGGLTFADEGIAKMIITREGNVGIGTTAPSGVLGVAQSTSGPGTVTTGAAGSSTVTGAVTDFTNTFKVGDTITVSGESAKTITSITSDTSLSISPATFALAHSTPTAYTLTGGTRLTVKGNGDIDIGTGRIYQGGLTFIHKTGTRNTFTGSVSGTLSVSGIDNSGFGHSALENILSGNNNTAVGSDSLAANTIGSNNSAFGKFALEIISTSGNSTAVGYEALQYNTGASNSALGAGALKGTASPASTGINNTAVGYNSLANNTTGSNNTALGYNAGSNSTASVNRTAIGANAIATLNNTMMFGDSSVKGWGFGAAITTAGVDAIKVGTNGTNGNGARLTVAGAWTSGSDRSKKHDIIDTSYGLNEVLQLRPVDFKWNGTNQQDIGFIAQEVKAIIPEIVYGKEGDMTLSYGQMTSILTKAIQEQQAQIEILKVEIEKLKAR